MAGTAKPYTIPAGRACSPLPALYPVPITTTCTHYPLPPPPYAVPVPRTTTHYPLPHHPPPPLPHRAMLRVAGSQGPVLRALRNYNWNDHSGILKDSHLLGRPPKGGLRPAWAQRSQVLFGALPAGTAGRRECSLGPPGPRLGPRLDREKIRYSAQPQGHAGL